LEGFSRIRKWPAKISHVPTFSHHVIVMQFALGSSIIKNLETDDYQSLV